MEEVLRIYERPFESTHPVVCMDEISRQLLGHVTEPVKMKPGSPRREDYEYERLGTFNVFMLFEPLTGWCRVKVTERHTGRDWAELMKEVVDEDFAGAKSIVLVADNLKTHSRASLYERYDATEALRIAERLDLRFTPKHGSWLNMAEIALSLLSRQCLNIRIASLEEATSRCEKWMEQHNGAAKRIDWRFTAADARVKLKRLYPVIEL